MGVVVKQRPISVGSQRKALPAAGFPRQQDELVIFQVFDASR